MHHDSTRIKRGPVLGFLLAIAALFLLAIISMGAQAQPLPNGYTRCGAEASGKLRSTGETVRGRISMMAVSPDGYWFWCQPWLKDGDDPTTPEPKPAPVCQGRDTYEEWTVGDLTCTRGPPASLPTRRCACARRPPAGRCWCVFRLAGRARPVRGLPLHPAARWPRRMALRGWHLLSVRIPGSTATPSPIGPRMTRPG